MSQDGIVQSSGYNGTISAPRSETQVVARTQRRRFTASYKLKILKEAEGCAGSGQISALLRREGLYSSNLSTWRRQRARGELSGLSPVKRGPQVDEAARQIEKLKRENERLRKKLDQAETIIEVQKKLSKLLGLEQEMQSQVNRSSR